MALREDQIVRYGRQILLRDVGGRGQERLLASPVRVLGEGPAIDDAVAWLQAGGTPIELIGARPSGFLHATPLELRSQEPPAAELVQHGLTSPAKIQVVVGAGVAYRSPAACDACWAATLETLAADPPESAGSLAALTLQRLLLGWSDALGIVRWRGDRFETGSISPCPHAPKPEQ